MFVRVERKTTPAGIIRSVAPDEIRGQKNTANNKPRQGFKKVITISRVLK